MESRIFYKIAAASAFLTAVTTFLLWLLPKLYEAPGFEEAVALAHNKYYILRLWVNFFHIPLALTAYFGLAYKLRKRQWPKVFSGMIWFTIWGAIEMIGIAIIIFTVNNNWRINYTAANEVKRSIFRSDIEAFYSIWDSMFFVLLIAFLFASVFFAWATWKGKGIEKLVSWLFWLAVPLTLLIILAEYAKLTWGDAIVNWVYPVLQPVSRCVLGLYLLKKEN